MALHYTLIRERPSDVSRMEGQPHNGLASSLDTWFVDSLGFGLGGICHLGLRRRLWTYRGPLLGHDHDDHHWLWRHLPSAESNMTKLFATFYLPLAVIALADAVSDVQMIGMRRKIRETDYSELADECLLRDAVRESTDNPNFMPVLTEAEFLIDQLISNSLVDEAAVAAIRRQFKHLTRRGTFKCEEDRRLTPSLVYEELRERARLGKRLSEGASSADLTQTGQFKWDSLQEWLSKSWRDRVCRKAMEEGGNLAHGVGTNVRQGGVRNAVGAVRSRIRR